MSTTSTPTNKNALLPSEIDIHAPLALLHLAVSANLREAYQESLAVIDRFIAFYSEQNTRPDLLIEICDTIMKLDALYSVVEYINIVGTVIEYLRIKLLSSSCQTVQAVVMIQDSLIKNGNYRIHSLIGQHINMKTLSKVARRHLSGKTSASQSVGFFILDTLQAWGEAFETRMDIYPHFTETYERLKSKHNCLFLRPDYDPTRVPIFLPELTHQQREEVRSFYNAGTLVRQPDASPNVVTPASPEQARPAKPTPPRQRSSFSPTMAAPPLKPVRAASLEPASFKTSSSATLVTSQPDFLNKPNVSSNPQTQALVATTPQDVVWDSADLQLVTKYDAAVDRVLDAFHHTDHPSVTRTPELSKPARPATKEHTNAKDKEAISHVLDSFNKKVLVKPQRSSLESQASSRGAFSLEASLGPDSMRQFVEQSLSSVIRPKKVEPHVVYTPPITATKLTQERYESHVVLQEGSSANLVIEHNDAVQEMVVTALEESSIPEGRASTFQVDALETVCVERDHTVEKESSIPEIMASTVQVDALETVCVELDHTVDISSFVVSPPQLPPQGPVDLSKARDTLRHVTSHPPPLVNQDSDVENENSAHVQEESERYTHEVHPTPKKPQPGKRASYDPSSDKNVEFKFFGSQRVLVRKSMGSAIPKYF